MGSMAYVALYRTWRPQDFSEIVGQDHIKTALTNALETGKISHAYLFTGPRGTGKTSTARILAKALNCEKGPTIHPCNQCEQCREISEGNSADVIEIDAASNRGIDEIRQLRDQVHFAPVSGRYKIYIIDEVHMITTEAFNALLKTLEEPPEHVVFIMATTEPQKVPITIQSRVQRYDFRRVTVDEITAHLEKVAKGSDIKAEPDALRLIAIQSDGGLRDAVSLLDQCSVMASPITAQTVRQVLGSVGREILRQLVAAVGQRDLSASLNLLTQLTNEGKDVTQILTELLEYLRALLLFQADPAYQEIYLTDTKENLEPLAKLYSRDRIIGATRRIHEAIQAVKNSTRRKIVTELCLFDLCREEEPSVDALISRVKELEQEVQNLSGGMPPLQTYTPPVRQTPVYTPPEPAPQPFVSPAPKAVSVQLVSAAVVDATGKGASGTEAEKKPKSVPMPDKPQHAAQSAPLVPGDLTHGQQLWRYVYEGLKKRRKRTFLVYAEMARVLAFDGATLTVGVTTHTSKERIEEIDFRNLLLEILKEGAGRDIELSVVLTDGSTPTPVVSRPRPQPAPKAAPAAVKEAPQPAPQAEQKPAPKTAPKAEVPEAQKKSEVQTDYPDLVKKAQQVFGGTVKEESES
jgi:DNA polymerase-3 subunit gamma/tau